MATETPPAGTYLLIGHMWRQYHDDGSQTIWERGDEVDLTAKEAARLVGQPYSCFIEPPDPSNAAIVEDMLAPSEQVKLAEKRQAEQVRVDKDKANAANAASSNAK